MSTNSTLPSNGSGARFDAAAIATAALDAGERKDLEAVSQLVTEECENIRPMSFTGRADDVGRTPVRQHSAGVFGAMQDVRFADRDVTVSADGRTVFVQCNGRFVTNAGAAYENVYVFRFDIEDGLISRWVEYFNPVTIGTVMGVPLGPQS